MRSIASETILAFFSCFINHHIIVANIAKWFDERTRIRIIADTSIALKFRTSRAVSHTK